MLLFKDQPLVLHSVKRSLFLTSNKENKHSLHVGAL